MPVESGVLGARHEYAETTPGAHQVNADTILLE
jgi:hypothetical protein